MSEVEKRRVDLTGWQPPTTYATGGLISYDENMVIPAVINPHPNERRIIVGDQTNQWLTWPNAPGTIPGMAHTDPIEYTHHTKRDSEAIQEIYWNANTLRLTVVFNNSGIYSYDDVAKSLYNSFATAESMGTFFRETFRESEWPGAKHDERRVRYIAVAHEGPDFDSDLDSLKADRLTNSKYAGNQKFRVDFEYNGKDNIEVRAGTHMEAIQIVKDYFEDRRVSVTVLGVYIEV